MDTQEDIRKNKIDDRERIQSLFSDDDSAKFDRTMHCNNCGQDKPEDEFIGYYCKSCYDQIHYLNDTEN